MLEFFFKNISERVFLDVFSLDIITWLLSFSETQNSEDCKKGMDESTTVVPFMNTPTKY